MNTTTQIIEQVPTIGLFETMALFSVSLIVGIIFVIGFLKGIK